MQDPYELKNHVASPEYARVREVMRERLLHRMVEAGEAEPAIVVAASSAGENQTFQGIREEEAWM